MTSKPIVSVLVMTYNHDRYIETALNSMLSQEVDFCYEIVIGEDCSTDETQRIVLDYQRNNPDIIRVITSERNVGAGENFKRTYEACRGKYIALCEGDDFWNDNTKLKKQVDFLENNPDYSITYHDYVEVRDQALSEKGYIEGLRSSGFRDLSSIELMNCAGGVTATVCFRKCFDDFPAEFFKAKAGDVFLRSLLGQYGKGKFLADISPSCYRIHAEGAWSGISQAERDINFIITRFWICTYYKRVGRTDVAGSIVFSAVTGLYMSFCGNKVKLVLWALKQLFPSWYKFYRERFF